MPRPPVHKDDDGDDDDDDDNDDDDDDDDDDGDDDDDDDDDGDDNDDDDEQVPLLEWEPKEEEVKSLLRNRKVEPDHVVLFEKISLI